MDGIIIINKPKGCTSHDIVYKVKKIFNEKVGHTGTLDPNATGVLPLLIGKGTKLSKYLINHDKTYEVVLKLGKKTDTADGEGNVIEEVSVDEKILGIEFVTEKIKSFIGKQEQIPPMYSAIKVKGKKLYEYARNGQKIEVKPREVEIYNIELININKEKKEISFKVTCSKGTYIRSLCEDISRALGTIGYMKELNRTQVGDFNIKSAISLEQLEHCFNDEIFIKSYFIHMEDVFKNNKNIILKKNELVKFLNGLKIKSNLKDGIYKIYDENTFIGTGKVEDLLLKRDIIING